ncbi:hypothetical protein LSM04_001425 [Trypanosoma melophagium]|uniref:uncharacterized protein n=1 Tax=Trypanosoma melophagium TaxID=715481 RepID=UPI00351A750F|nr:hypothetical protein LSM04_001425 [Trypanosoma melophagium]
MQVLLLFPLFDLLLRLLLVMMMLTMITPSDFRVAALAHVVGQPTAFMHTQKQLYKHTISQQWGTVSLKSVSVCRSSSRSSSAKRKTGEFIVPEFVPQVWSVGKEKQEKSLKIGSKKVD